MRFGLVACFALWVGGCGAVHSDDSLAVAEPLQEIATPESPPAPRTTYLREVAPDGTTKVAGPTVVGSRGEGLNVATSVHQIFLAMGIPTEVRCVERSDAAHPMRVQTQLEIVFLEGLNPTQQRQVERVLTSLDAKTVTLQ